MLANAREHLHFDTQTLPLFFFFLIVSQNTKVNMYLYREIHSWGSKNHPMSTRIQCASCGVSRRPKELANGYNNGRRPPQGAGYPDTARICNKCFQTLSRQFPKQPKVKESPKTPIITSGPPRNLANRFARDSDSPTMTRSQRKHLVDQENLKPRHKYRPTRHNFLHALYS